MPRKRKTSKKKRVTKKQKRRKVSEEQRIIQTAIGAAFGIAAIKLVS